MTLDDEYQQYKGQSVLVPGEPESERGQCVQWADYVLHDVYDLPYHYGNAVDWWNNPGALLNNFNRISDGSVKKGDFVVFNALVGSPFGHIDVAMVDGSTSGFEGADSNWGGNLTVHLVQHNNPNFVLGSLRLKGGGMPITTDQLYELIRGIARREPTQAEVTNQDYINNPGLAIDTFWNNGGSELYKNPPTPPGATKLSPGLYEV